MFYMNIRFGERKYPSKEAEDSCEMFGQIYLCVAMMMVQNFVHELSLLRLFSGADK